MHTIQKQVNNTNHIIPARDALIFFTVILAITIVTRIGHFPASVINWDESLTLLVSRDILNGILPYDGAFEHKPVALYYIFSLSQLLFGESIYAIRILAIIVVSLTGFFLTILMRTVASSGILASVSTGAVYVTFSIQNSGQATLSEIIINFYLVAALLMFNTIKLEKYKHLSVGISFLTGFILGFAIQTNYLSLVIIIPFFIMNAINIILMVRNKDKHSLNLYLKNSLVVLISLIGTFLILLMPIAIWGDIENYFTKQVNFLLGYKSTINTETYIYKLLSSLSKYKELIVLAIAFIIYKMSKVIHRESSITNESDISWQAIIYLIGSLLAAISSGRVYPHYFILLLPSLCILNGLIIEKLSRHNSIRKYLAITISLYIGIISLNTVTKHSAKPLYKYLQGWPADRPQQTGLLKLQIILDHQLHRMILFMSMITIMFSIIF
jgi:hypothetical protein